MALRREVYERQRDGSTLLVEVIILDRDGGRPRFTRERPPGSVEEQRAATQREAAALVADEAADLLINTRARLAAFDSATATAADVANAVSDILAVLGML